MSARLAEAVAQWAAIREAAFAREVDAPALRPADGSDHVTRTHTPPRRNPDGSETYTVQRACNGCGRDIGDATADELDAAVDGATMPDVRDECGCSNPVVQEIAVALCDVEHDWHFPCWQCIQRAAAFASRVRQQTLHDDILWPQPPTLREQVAKAWCADYYGEYSGSARNQSPEQLAAADAVLAVVADWLAAQPMPYPDVVTRGQRDHDVRLLRGGSDA